MVLLENLEMRGDYLTTDWPAEKVKACVCASIALDRASTKVACSLFSRRS